MCGTSADSRTQERGWKDSQPWTDNPAAQESLASHERSSNRSMRSICSPSSKSRSHDPPEDAPFASFPVFILYLKKLLGGQRPGLHRPRLW